MLEIILPPTEKEDAVELRFEHSLVSVSKWESIHQKAFFGRDPKTEEETTSYIKCMLLDNQNYDFKKKFKVAQYNEITEYINSKQTATTFREDPSKKPSRDIITSELVYSWMIEFGIPFQPCETWHLNRLMTLIQVCGVKQTKPKKMSQKALAEQYRNLNAQRRSELGTSG